MEAASGCQALKEQIGQAAQMIVGQEPVAAHRIMGAHPLAVGKEAPPQATQVIVEQGGEENILDPAKFFLMRVEQPGLLQPNITKERFTLAWYARQKAATMPTTWP